MLSTSTVSKLLCKTAKKERKRELPLWMPGDWSLWWKWRQGSWWRFPSPHPSPAAPGGTWGRGNQTSRHETEHWYAKISNWFEVKLKTTFNSQWLVRAMWQQLRIGNLLLLWRLQLLHGLVILVVDLLLQLLTMVLHRLDLLRPALLVLVQLLHAHTQTERNVHAIKKKYPHTQYMYVYTVINTETKSAFSFVCGGLAEQRTDPWELYLHSRIQLFIQFANLLPQLLQVVGLVQDVRVHLEETQRKCFSSLPRLGNKHLWYCRNRRRYLLTRLLQAEFHVGQLRVLLLHVADELSQAHLKHKNSAQYKDSPACSIKLFIFILVLIKAKDGNWPLNWVSRTCVSVLCWMTLPDPQLNCLIWKSWPCAFLADTGTSCSLRASLWYSDSFASSWGEKRKKRAGQTPVQVHWAHSQPQAGPLLELELHTDPLFGFGQSDLLVPLVLLCLFKRLGEAADGLLELPLLPVDPLNVGWSELLVLVLELELEPLVVVL